MRWHAARIAQVIRRTPNAVSVFFSNPLGTHRAGQHVDLRLVADDGYEARRSYSIASAPGSERIELLIERLADGEVSPFLHDVAQVGDTLELLGPLGGHFVWPQAEPRPLLLLAGGSGIAPLMAMLRLRDQAFARLPAALLYSARTWDELAFRDELMAMADASAWFAPTFATTREAPRRPQDAGRHVDAAMVAGVVAALPEPGLAQAYLCGSTGFVETAAGALVEAGIAPARISAERYGGA